MYGLYIHEASKMTDMNSAKKKVVRSRVRRFALDLWDAPLDQGLQLYQNTIKELYQNGARLRMCLKCGVIDTIQDLTDKGSAAHKCALDFSSFPVLVTTSWKKMAEFFLSDRYVKALQKIGVEPEVERVVVTAPVEQEIEVPTKVTTRERSDITDRVD